MPTLPIAHAWGGDLLPPARRAYVQLVPREHDLQMRVVAPMFHDPPPDQPIGSTPKLWEHEVVECFIAGADDRYLEIEVGPHGHYLVLMLDGVRQVRAMGLPMKVEITQSEQWWIAEASIPRAWLPPPPHRVNAFAIHGPPQARAYTLHHRLPGATPDFHQPKAFPSVHLDAPSPADTWETHTIELFHAMTDHLDPRPNVPSHATGSWHHVILQAASHIG